MQTYSQVFQDAFVLKLLGPSGYFLDVGGGWDANGINTNTLLLEESGWDGIVIDGDMGHAILRNERTLTATVICTMIPQTTLKSLLVEHNAPKIIDYVSIDIEPSSLIALYDFPFEDYEFKVLTFEHDSYRIGATQKQEATRILTEKGYVCMCEDVKIPDILLFGEYAHMNGVAYFEDWWIHPNHFSPEFISKNTFKGQTGRYIVEHLEV
jgi:hypothetical protein